MELSYAAGRKINRTNHWGKVWQFLMKLTKLYPLMQQFHSEVFTQGKCRHRSTKKDWNVKVYIEFIHDGLKLETIQVPINQRTEGTSIQ